MIALVLAMVWARRAQAAALALLSMFGVAAAVAAPAYLRAADRAVANAQVRAAPAGDRSVSLSLALGDTRGKDPAQDPAQAGGSTSTLRTATGLTAMPGFRYVYAAQVDTLGMEHNTDQPTKLVFRQDVCAHLTMVAGRCLLSESDVVISDDTAQRLGLHPGQAVSLAYASYNNAQTERTYEIRGAPKRLLVAGVYRATDPADTYWGTHDYFTGQKAVFATEDTMSGMDLGAMVVTVDGYAGPGALDADHLPGIAPALSTLRANAAGQGSHLTLATGLPDLLTRIAAARVAAHRIVPVLAVALVLLSCLTIYLAAGYGAEGRRPELAVVALRGARAPQRWWLAVGESVVAIAIGAVLGTVAGQLLINLVAAIRFPGIGADPNLGSLRWAPVTFGVALITAVLAQYRPVATPVLELLRRVPPARGVARAVAFELVVLLLAGIAVVQLVTGHGQLSGLGTFATALTLIAAALLAARLIMWGVAAYARRSLRRGRLGFALAVLHLSRRPGGVRLLALLTAAVAVAGYASCAVDHGARGRQAQAALQVGAAHTVTVSPVAASRLLDAVHQVDPDGRYAMAAVRIPASSQSAPLLAVDTTRLAAVASWPDGAPGLDTVAGILHPPAGDPIHLAAGRALDLDITASGFGGSRPDLAFRVSSGAGEDQVWIRDLTLGRRTYTPPVGACGDGCTLDSIQVYRPGTLKEVSGTLIVRGLSGRWVSTDGGYADPTADGLRIRVNLTTSAVTLDIQPATAPRPLPMLSAGPVSGLTVDGLDGLALPVHRAATVPVIPGLGKTGVLVDLDYANRLVTGAENANESEVWLGDRAPADILARLRTAGLTPTADVRAADVRAALDTGGPALGLLFFVVVAALATLLAAGALALMAAVDRARRVEDLGALRVQGLAPGDLRRAVLWTHPLLVALAVVTGLAIGTAGWRGTGWALPLGITVPVSPWPSPWVLLITAGLILLTLVTVAAIAGRRVLRQIR